jgi:hypothetical protein
MHCASCVPRGHRTGAITYAHQRLGAALIPPDVRAVVALRPAPRGRHEGTENKACERHAAKRVVAKRRQAPPHRTCIGTAESLRAKAPPIETLHHDELPYLLGGNEGAHAFVFPQSQAAEQAGRVTSDARQDRAAQGIPRFRFVNAVPRNAANGDVRGNCREYGESGAPTVQPCSGVTD